MTDFKYDIGLSDEMLIMLLRGGVVNYKIPGLHVVLRQEKELVVIKRDDYRDLKKHMHEPYILENIFRNIDL